jgi:hypothetical protein
VWVVPIVVAARFCDGGRSAVCRGAVRDARGAVVLRVRVARGCTLSGGGATETGGNACGALCALLSEYPIAVRHNETTPVAAPTYKRFLLFLKLLTEGPQFHQS